MAITLPDQVYWLYSEMQRWLAAAGSIQQLSGPPAASQDELPCRGTPASLNILARDQYFPPGVLGCDDSGREVLSNAYSEQLKAFGEQSLWALSRIDPHARVYRFLWLRAFDQPVSARLVINSDLTGNLALKIGAEIYEPARLIHSETKPIGRHGTGLWFARVFQTGFWDLPSGSHLGGFDGARWILEGVSDGKYQVVDHWSPARNDPVYILGMTLVSDLAGVRIDPEKVY